MFIDNTAFSPFCFFSGAAARFCAVFRVISSAAPLKNKTVHGAQITLNMAPRRGLGLCVKAELIFKKADEASHPLSPQKGADQAPGTRDLL
jgi:hypothetical protein